MLLVLGIIACLAGLALLLYAGFLAFMKFAFMPNETKRDKVAAKELLATGETALAYVIVASDELRERDDSDEYRWSQIVFAKGAGETDLEDRLRQMGGKLLKFKVKDETDRTERMIRQVFGTQLPLEEHMKLPQRVAGDLDAYTTSLKIHWSKFKKRKLAADFVWIRYDPDKDSRHVLVPEAGSDYEKELERIDEE